VVRYSGSGKLKVYQHGILTREGEIDRKGDLSKKGVDRTGSEKGFLRGRLTGKEKGRVQNQDGDKHKGPFYFMFLRMG